MEEPSLQLGRAEQDALMRNVAMMNEVAKRMKQIPELPSEKPTDNHPLQRVEFPDEGEIYTYMEGYDYPYRGYPFYEFVDKIDLIKKLSRQLQSGFYHGLNKKWYRWLLIPLVPSLGRSLFWACTYSFYRLVVRFQMRTNRFCQFVQELHRAASVCWGDEDPHIAELRTMLRDIECMILEFDNAYRFRAQDLLPELNKEALRKNPIKEITRLLDIWIEREKTKEIKDSWKLLKLFVKYYLRFDKPMLRMIARLLAELDLEKCKLTTEDKYFAIPRLDYSFEFMRNPSPADETLIKKVKLQKDFEAKRGQIEKQSTVEHEILKKLHEKERAEGEDSDLEKKHHQELANLDHKFDKQLLELEKQYLVDKAQL